jgi:hypothetical protein
MNDLKGLDPFSQKNRVRLNYEVKKWDHHLKSGGILGVNLENLGWKA